MRIFKSLAILIGLGVAASAVAASRQPELETWVSQELTPYLARQLSTHPRFRDESVSFVVMKDGNPQPVASALAIALRDQLQNALMDTPGIHIAWHPDQPNVSHLPGSSNVDCRADQIHYYIGLELSEQHNGTFELSLRALDLEDRSWVAGFGKTWTGSLTTSQFRAWREVGTDQTFLGERAVPFTESQTDLLAAQLAHKLGCSLLQQVAGEYIAAPVVDAAAEPNNMIELVANNLAAYRALQLTPDEASANAAIEAKAHRVDDDLFQYWISIRPKDASSELPAISASAYVYLSSPFLTAEKASLLPATVPGRTGAVLQNARLVELEGPQSCHSQFDCYALLTRSNRDAVVFFLHHQLNHGLVRLSGEYCDQHAAARIVRANESISFSLLTDDAGSGSWLQGDRWESNPTMDTYYVVAASDGKAARALARHIERLPQRCTGSVRNGLDGPALQRWLTELNAIADNWNTQIDWQIIRVKNTY